MTVQDLIKSLQMFPADAVVLIGKGDGEWFTVRSLNQWRALFTDDGYCLEVADADVSRAVDVVTLG